jgi:hypothetical protein
VIKEVTTCNYVVVVDTPRLCEEPALAQVEDEVRKVRCQPILSDEELAQRQSATATIEGDAKAPAPIIREKAPYVNEDLKEAARKGRENMKASIESIVSQINNAAGAPTATELGVIVGWDEEGKFMVARKEQEAEPDKTEQPSTEEASDASRAKDKWDVLLEKLLELEDEIVDAAEGEIILATVQDSGDVVLEKTKDVPAAIEKQQQQQTQKQEQEVKTPPPDKAATETKTDAVPVRTIQMTREKESLGQRAERFYKEQEAQKQREEEAKKHLARDHHEL